MIVSKLFILSLAAGMAIFVGACPDKKQANINANANVSTAPPSPEKIDNAKIKSSPGAASAAMELQFIDSLTAHHEIAIAMAKEVEGKLTHPELAEFAKKIAAEQQKEIDQMKKWRSVWYPGDSPAINADMPGMSYSVVRWDMAALRAAAGSEKDVEFMSQLIPHDQGAILIANEGLHKTENPEIHKLCEELIRTRGIEMKQMQDWQSAWIKPY